MARTVREWIDRADPQALLNAVIFFDFRPVYGNHTLALDLRSGSPLMRRIAAGFCCSSPATRSTTSLRSAWCASSCSRAEGSIRTRWI